jgi:hypothetical protein
MHTTLVCPALREQLQAASNIHEMHKQVVFGVESLHLTAQYPCNSWSAHVSAQPITKKLMAAVRVCNPSEHEPTTSSCHGLIGEGQLHPLITG